MRQERSRQDFERLLDKLEREPDFAAVGREFIGTFLVGLAHGDDRVARDWARRNEAPHLWAHRYRKVVANLSETLRKRPDEAATEMRAAVTAAVKGASRTPTERPARNYNNLSDAEYAAELKREYGINSKLI